MSTFALNSPVLRVALVQDHPGETPVVGPMDAALLFKKHIGDYDREALPVIMLGAGRRLIGFNLVSIGTLTATAEDLIQAACLALPVEVSPPRTSRLHARKTSCRA